MHFKLRFDDMKNNDFLALSQKLQIKLTIKYQSVILKSLTGTPLNRNDWQKTSIRGFLAGA
jgi:hypothetical protein